VVIDSTLLSATCLGGARAEIEALRVTAWAGSVQDRSLLGRFSFDHFDLTGRHRLIRDRNGCLIAASRLCVIAGGEPPPDVIGFKPVLHRIRYPALFLNRSVVHPACRRQGLWRQMIRQNLVAARQLKPVEIWSESAGSRVSYLLKLGFEEVCPSADTTIPGKFVLLRYRPQRHPDVFSAALSR